MSAHYVNDAEGFKIKMKESPGGGETKAHLLWGDRVRVIDDTSNPQHIQVAARAREGWIPRSAVTVSDGLLELYVIDVGQGDGILMRTPHDDAWHVLDAGVPNSKQMTRKGAANFIRWKFIDDLGRDRVTLKNMIVSHSDLDHYGGMLDLFAGVVERPTRHFTFEVQNFYHSGIGRFANAPDIGNSGQGTVGPLPFPDYGISQTDTFIIELLDGKNSFATPARPFAEDFAALAGHVANVPGSVRRLSHKMGFLPGYDATQPVSIKVLGPIEETFGSQLGLRNFGKPSLTTNGNSVVMRIDYDKTRILLTGDLNTDAQRLLLSYWDPREFASDVAKGCHHGSDDVDLRFVQAMGARTTVISSGDNESHSHPRPRIVGASARYGREAKGLDNKVMPPLIYSTELARSVKLNDIDKVRKAGDSGSAILAASGEIRGKQAGAKYQSMEFTPISTDLVYGLINIRTDGTRIMCGYMEEAGGTGDFELQVFKAGVIV